MRYLRFAWSVIVGVAVIVLGWIFIKKKEPIQLEAEEVIDEQDLQESSDIDAAADDFAR